MVNTPIISAGLLLSGFAASCSNDSKTITITAPGDPSATIVPGDTLPLDTTVTADGSGDYTLPDGAVRLS